MAISSNDIIGKAQTVLQDNSATRWPTTELLSSLNDGQREICLLKPSVSATNQSVALVAGTKQTIPAVGLQVLRIVRNLTSAGLGGKVVRIISRDVLDTVEPAQVTSGGTITIPDIHSNNLLDYILYRAYAKETDHAGSEQRSSQHYQAMISSLGVKIQLDAVTSPNMRTVAQG